MRQRLNCQAVFATESQNNGKRYRLVRPPHSNCSGSLLLFRSIGSHASWSTNAISPRPEVSGGEGSTVATCRPEFRCLEPTVFCVCGSVCPPDRAVRTKTPKLRPFGAKHRTFPAELRRISANDRRNPAIDRTILRWIAESLRCFAEFLPSIAGFLRSFVEKVRSIAELLHRSQICCDFSQKFCEASYPECHRWQKFCGAPQNFRGRSNQMAEAPQSECERAGRSSEGWSPRGQTADPKVKTVRSGPIVFGRRNAGLPRLSFRPEGADVTQPGSKGRVLTKGIRGLKGRRSLARGSALRRGRLLHEETPHPAKYRDPSGRNRSLPLPRPAPGLRCRFGAGLIWAEILPATSGLNTAVRHLCRLRLVGAAPDPR